MRNFQLFTCFCLLYAACGFTQVMPSVVVPDFSLRNASDNTMFSTAADQGVKGYMVVFTCNHCPFAKLYTQRFNNLHARYRVLGVPLLAINSMDTVVYEDEVFELMQQKARAENIKYPYLQDADQRVGQSFDAQHTPQAYVIWKEKGQWVVKYSGAIDDNGEHPENATPFIANAVDELLAGKQVSNPQTQSFGCRIFYRN
ncbi:MAG: redoxin domain-containing protein [Saprospiraceae bacterium]|jgi:peroxiredoxin